MVQLTEQLWKLEAALAQSQEQAMFQMQLMKSKMELLNTFVKDTLKAANNNASRMEMAARVYEMGRISDVAKIERQMARYNKDIKSE